jgi:hypothetical protein
MSDPVVNLFKDFLNSDFMDSLILYRLKDDYETVVAYIDGLSERSMFKSLSDIDLKDFDTLMDDMIGLQQVIRMYECSYYPSHTHGGLVPMEKEQPVTIDITNYDEETGVIDFEIDESAKEKLIQMGFKYMLMLGLLKIDEDEVFKILEAHKQNELKETLNQSYDYWHEGSPV